LLLALCLKALDLFLRSLHRLLFVPNVQDALLLGHLSSPFGEVGQVIETFHDGLRQESVSGKGIDAQNKRCCESLRKRDLAAAPEERRGVLEQGLNLLADNFNKLLAQRLLIRFLCLQDLKPEAAGLGEPRVDEEVNAGADQCVFGVTGSGEDVRGIRISQEGGDDATLCDNLAIEVDGGDETALDFVNGVLIGDKVNLQG
jgi:hypothetical protein